MTGNSWQRMFPAQPAVADDPLERLDRLQQCCNALRRGEALPAPIVAWLLDGFTRFIDEGGDLGKRLGFKVRRGGRFHTVPNLDRMRRRDELLCVLVHEQGAGSLRQRCIRAADFLRGRGAEPLPGFSGAVRRMLQELDVQIPDAKRIQEIVKLRVISRFGQQST